MKFKTMEWIRKVRDENYEKCKGMEPKEKIQFTKKTAKELAEKRCSNHAGVEKR